MKKETSYNPFEIFVFRTPAIPLKHYYADLKGLEKDGFWYDFLRNSYIQEALFLASPDLFSEVNKFLQHELRNEKEISKLKMSVLRYYTRMSSRCTPFGLFAGFSLGKLNSGTEIVLSISENNKRYTRLDMNYLCNLAQVIAKQEEIKELLLYYPNTSLYTIGDKMRYVEWHYRNSKRTHQISAIDYSDYIDIVLSKAKSGASINELAESIIDEEITLEESKEFVNTLIEEQVLVSELDPSITGRDFVIQILETLERINPKDDSLKKRLEKIIQLLSHLDNAPIGTSVPVYEKIEKIVKEINISHEQKYLFQTDMFKPVEKAFLEEKLINHITDAIILMNRLTLPARETILTKFAENYYERYEDREMPLLQVLDTESGIGYPVNSGDVSSLLDGFAFPYNMPEQEIKWNRIQSVFHKKMINAYKESAYSIEIQDSDFDFLPVNWSDLPDTFSCMCELFSYDENSVSIYVHNAGGSSAGNLLGRFCHITKKLEEYVLAVTEHEQKNNPDVVFAEIVHLPESRIGNILLRPVLRSYEIPYLAKASVGEEYQILPDDLHISVKMNTIILRSKKLNKQIIPRMSTAHNYSMNSMPVYHFLCDMQTQGLRGGIGFNLGSLMNEYDFLPRVIYKNILLSLAEWKVNVKEFNSLIEKKDKETLIPDVNKWRLEKQIPRYVTLVDGDNDLLIDFESYISNEVKQDENLRWILALKMIDVLLDSFKYTLEEKSDLLKTLQENFVKEFDITHNYRKQFAQRYRTDRTKIEPVLASDNDSNLFYHIYEKQERIKNTVNDILNNMDRIERKNNLLSSYIHMMMNRLFRTQQRKYELVLYDFLSMYYNSKMARIRKNK